jgi:putative beta-lysine N-acetyltransferase
MFPQDKEVKIGHSLVQHGKFNDRVYVMDYKYALDPYLIDEIQLLAEDLDYGKIIIKIPKAAKPKFSREDFEMEAKIPKFYNGKNACFFAAKYNRKSREEVSNKKEILEILEKLESDEKNDFDELSDAYSIHSLREKDVNEITHIYKKVFKTYPFPIHDTKYIKKTMLENTIYFGAFNHGELIAISSCNVNNSAENVEMTDFAILPAFRGNKLASHLLSIMEDTMQDLGIKTAYTIARSISLPMNATFSNAGYNYAGTLWNNTQISGTIESMNIWYKPLINNK